MKKDIKYRDHAYFEPACQYIVYQAVTYLKSYNQFCDDVFIAKYLSNEDILSNIVEIQRQSQCIAKKRISD